MRSRDRLCCMEWRIKNKLQNSQCMLSSEDHWEPLWHLGGKQETGASLQDTVGNYHTTQTNLWHLQGRGGSSNCSALPAGPEPQRELTPCSVLSLLHHVCHLGLTFQTCKRGTLTPTAIASLVIAKIKVVSDLNWHGVKAGKKSSCDLKKKKTLRTFGTVGTVGIRKCWDVCCYIFVFLFCCCVLFYVRGKLIVRKEVNAVRMEVNEERAKDYGRVK